MSKPRDHQVRIIGGEWRGRKLTVARSEGLRPTPDRIRETLFNWISAHCQNGVVLDCFAGSGVLGFEAASRGASKVILVEKERSIGNLLTEQVLAFNTDKIKVVANDIERYLSSCSLIFDVVFIDPPYAEPELRQTVIDILLKQQLLAHNAMIYIEWPHHESFEIDSNVMGWHRRKRAGQIEYAVAQPQLSR